MSFDCLRIQLNPFRKLLKYSFVDQSLVEVGFYGHPSDSDRSKAVPSIGEQIAKTLGLLNWSLNASTSRYDGIQLSSLDVTRGENFLFLRSIDTSSWYSVRRNGDARDDCSKKWIIQKQKWFLTKKSQQCGESCWWRENTVLIANHRKLAKHH